MLILLGSKCLGNLGLPVVKSTEEKLEDLEGLGASGRNMWWISRETCSGQLWKHGLNEVRQGFACA